MLASLIVLLAIRMTFASAVMNILYAATVPMTLAVVARLVMQGHPFYLAMAAMAVGLHVYFIFLAKGLNATALAMLEYRAEKDALIAEIEEEKSISDEARRRAEAANISKSRFLATMSHELRTPLNAVIGYSELILDGIYGEVPEKVRGVMERVEVSGRHLLGLINDVLDLSKIEAGQLTLSLADYSMRDVVDTAVTSVEALAAAKGLGLKTSVPQELPIGKGDPQRLTQVLLNLLGNAIKFTEAGEIRVEVGVTRGEFIVSVIDTGPGIPANDRARIFEEFQQLDSSSTRRKGGSGLGLSIALRIVKLHGGSIEVLSTLGEGSIFRVSLPVRVAWQTDGQ
jgi:two-component system cell cycle sensor histidine kinase PleC